MRLQIRVFPSRYSIRSAYVVVYHVIPWKRLKSRRATRITSPYTREANEIIHVQNDVLCIA